MGLFPSKSLSPVVTLFLKSSDESDEDEDQAIPCVKPQPLRSSNSPKHISLHLIHDSFIAHTGEHAR
jgi:hypothetical protein